MSPLDAAWSILKSRPASPGGREYSQPELERLRAFVHANIESPDPQLQAQAQQLLEELTTAMSFAGGRTGLPTTPSDGDVLVGGAEPTTPGAAEVGVIGDKPPQEVRREADEQ
jgi:hypothetical protein